MATASIDRGMLWTDLEGRELAGGWRLKRLVRPEGRNAWFEATGMDGKPALVSITEAMNDEEELLVRLRAAAVIHHPNVVAVRDARLVWLGETPAVLAAMEPTDENLAEVLRERALDAREARSLMDALLQGLAAIHGQRLVHGRMVAGSVLAIGNTVKLRSDCLHAEDFAADAAEDVRGVGRIVTQALTRRIPVNESDAAVQMVPEPLARAVRRALSGEATVEEVAELAGIRIVKAKDATAAAGAAQEKRPATVAEMPKPQEPEKKVESARPVAVRTTVVMPEARETRAPMDLPLIPRSKAVVDEDEDEDEASGPKRGWPVNWNYHRRGAPWVIGVAAALVIGTALMLHSWLGSSHAAKPVAHAKQVVVVKRVPPVAARVAAPVAKPAAGNRIWKVVVYTYRNRKDAAQRARDLGKRYPTLQPGVMKTHRGDYLVTLGGSMTRADAMALRSRAVRMGLPRDTYAQNFR